MALAEFQSPVTAATQVADLVRGRVALLGEMTHGTAEFYETRAAVTMALAQNGFNIVALEADWPDAAMIDEYVRWRRRDLAPWLRHARWPGWMWRNQQFLDFVERLRRHNEGQAEEDQVMVCGLDLYSMGESIAAVVAYLQRKDPDAAAAARGRYGCLARWERDPSRYGAAVQRRLADCQSDVVRVLGDLLHRRLDQAGLFDAQQNARVVAGAERYYRSLYEGDTSSWNVRDTHMLETLQQAMHHRGPRAKAVVWAHNSHVGDARGSEMGDLGETTLGTLCRQWTDCWVLGAFTHDGTVVAGQAWDAPWESMEVRPSRPDSHGAWLGGHGDRYVLELEDPGPDRLERAIGVVYRPGTERLSHHFVSRLGARFDAVLWWRTTRGVDPLPVREAPVPDLWPSAL